LFERLAEAGKKTPKKLPFMGARRTNLVLPGITHAAQTLFCRGLRMLRGMIDGIPPSLTPPGGATLSGSP